METKQFKALKRLAMVGLVIFYLLVAGVAYLITNRPDKPAVIAKTAMLQPKPVGVIVRKDFIPPYWFTHVITNAKGRRIIQDFQPQQFIIYLNTGYHFYTDQAAYDTLKLNRQWQSK